jgi:hypothetical protein
MTGACFLAMLIVKGVIALGTALMCCQAAVSTFEPHARNPRVRVWLGMSEGVTAMTYSGAEEQAAQTESVPIDGLSPRALAQLIRGLDSRLTAITCEQRDGEKLLIYTFDVAGKVQSFHMPLTPAAIESIADLYPDAAAHEQELSRLGLLFHPPAGD